MAIMPSGTVDPRLDIKEQCLKPGQETDDGQAQCANVFWHCRSQEEYAKKACNPPKNLTITKFKVIMSFCTVDPSLKKYQHPDQEPDDGPAHGHRAFSKCHGPRESMVQWRFPSQQSY
jgi:hypothetical protein